MMIKIETTSAGLTNVLLRLTKEMVKWKEPKVDKKNEFEVENFSDFTDKQTNIVIQAIQALLVVLKNPSMQTDVIFIISFLSFLI